jgi:hypothetical protein
MVQGCPQLYGVYQGLAAHIVLVELVQSFAWIEESWVGYLAQAEKPRLCGEAAPLQRCRTTLPESPFTRLPPPTHREPGNTATKPLINSHPPFRSRLGVSLQGAMTLHVWHVLC